jgi:hypothetical protein
MISYGNVSESQPLRLAPDARMLSRMAVLRFALTCTLLACFARTASADDDVFPILEDTLLVPYGWQASPRKSDGDEIAILQDTLIEPWEPIPTRSRKQADCDCGIIVPRGW